MSYTLCHRKGRRLIQAHQSIRQCIYSTLQGWKVRLWRTIGEDCRSLFLDQSLGIRTPRSILIVKRWPHYQVYATYLRILYTYLASAHRPPLWFPGYGGVKMTLSDIFLRQPKADLEVRCIL